MYHIILVLCKNIVCIVLPVSAVKTPVKYFQNFAVKKIYNMNIEEKVSRDKKLACLQII